MSELMHLAAIVTHSPSPHTIGTWRSARSWRGWSYDRPEVWEHLARTLERGCFDMVFFADSFDLHDAWRDSPDTAVRYAVQYPKHDPLPLLALMARQTEHLGLASTLSTTYLHPYYVARVFATLDHLSGGRAGWNVVTSFGQNEARNFGLDAALPHDERYDRADEFMEVCYKLWDSWEPDAIVFDRESGVFADPAKVHRIDHEGKWFRCQGPLQVPRSPQGRPVIIQAGSSDRGSAFAGRHAEVVFSVRRDGAGMRRQRQALDADVIRHGRDPKSVKVLWAANPIVAETEQEAKAKYQRMLELVTPEAGLALMSGHFSYDLSTLPMDQPLSQLEVQGSQGILRGIIEDFGDELTLAEAGRLYGAGMMPHLVGTPAQVADQMEQLFDDAGGDGFMFRSSAIPTTMEDVVDLLVPELQARGRLRKQYSGHSLRDHFGEE